MTATFKVPSGLSEADRRAYRRAVQARLDRDEAPPEPLGMSVAEGARLLLEQFERSEISLFGYPRELVDFDRAYASLERTAS